MQKTKEPGRFCAEKPFFKGTIHAEYAAPCSTWQLYKAANVI